MTTIRDEKLWKDQATEAFVDICGKLNADEVDWPAALKQTADLKDELDVYNRGPAVPREADKLDRVFALLRFLQAALARKDRKRALHYVDAASNILT